MAEWLDRVSLGWRSGNDVIRCARDVSVPSKHHREVSISLVVPTSADAGIRGMPGKVHFSPDELKTVVFGFQMESKKRQKVRKLLSGKEWSHVQMTEVKRKHDGFKLKVVNC